MRTTSRIPHTRGDGPSPEFVENLKGMYSPHAWGWTVDQRAYGLCNHVFPTRVGMDRGHPRMP